MKDENSGSLPAGADGEQDKPNKDVLADSAEYTAEQQGAQGAEAPSNAPDANSSTPPNPKQAAAAAAAQALKDAQPPKPPPILLEPGKEYEIIDKIEQALIDKAPHIYQRSGKIVEVGRTVLPTSEKPVDGVTPTVEVVAIDEVADWTLHSEITRVVGFKKEVGGKRPRRVDAAPDVSLIKAYKGRSTKNLPMLAGVVHTPLILPDGRLITAEGYDKGTGLLFDFRGAAFPVVMRKPSKSDAEQALSRMRKRSKTFPFVDAASEAADMSMLFTTVFRRVLSAAPGHLATATKPGTGKSYRTDTASIYATGHRAGVIPYDSEDQAEMQKTLVSLMLEGVAVITIDNIDGVLKNTLLTQMLTQPFVKPRQLNFNKAPHYPTNLAVNANGNGVQLSFDLMRRFIISRLDAGVPYPEKRPFDFNPLDLAKAHRPQVIADMITILLYYENAGRPDQPALGDNYRDWASWIIGALMHLGMEDPRQTADDMRENASDTENFNSLMLQWKVAAGYGVPVTAGKLVEMALKSSDNPGGRHFDHLHFYELLQLLAADAGKISSRRLGEYLKKRVDYVTEIEEERPGNPVTWRYRLVKEKKKDSYTGVALWRVDKFDLQGNPAPDMPPSVDQVLPPRETDDYPAF